MARGEKGRRRPWREKKPGGPHKPGTSNNSGRNVEGGFKSKKQLEGEDDYADLPSFSDLSDDDVSNAGAADAETIKDDVAKFAANLGLAVDGFSGGGFDDRDFRKPPKKKAEGKNGKGGAEGGKGPQDGGLKTQKGSEDEEGGPKKRKKKKGVEKPPLPPPPEAAPPLESSAFAPAESIFDAGAGGVEDAPMGPWYEQAAALSEKLLPAPASDVTKKKKKGPADVSNKGPGDWDELVRRMRAGGEELLQRAAEEYERGQGKSGKDVQWLVRARKAGTSADKVAAMTVMLQEDPPANVRSLDALLGMVSNKGGKRNAAIAIDALRELFVTSLLPDHKLKYIAQRPELGSLEQRGKEGEPLLKFWSWEDALKQRYDTFVTSLDALSRDNLQFLKEKALKTLFDLLAAKPEQEAKLLSALVNKLGDPERKVASKAGYLLARLLEQHPNMKRVVVQEVEAFTFRPHVGLRAKYYAVVFLNQIVLYKKADGSALAKSLIGLYFGLFKALTSLEADAEPASTNNFKKSLGKRPRQKTKEVKKIIRSKKKRLAAKGGVIEDSTVGVDSRILSAILTGVNRAFPYVAADDVDALLQEHTPELFRMVHAGNFNVSVQALLLLHQLMSSHQAVSERFYRALYAVLLSPALAKSSKAALFLSVLFKAMKSDLDSKRIAAFAKRLLQVAAHQSPPFACGALLLVSEVLKIRPVLWGAVQQPEDKGDDVEHFEDVREDDGDADGPKILDDTRPNESHPVEPPAPSSGQDITGPVLGFPGEDDASDDVSDAAEGDSSSDSDSDAEERRRSFAGASTSALNTNWGVKEEVKVGGETGEGWPAKGRYDAKSREPSFCHAETACWWEITVLAAHAHPSVAAMAKTLLAGANVLYDGDPLRDLALSIFLDRFIEKKPRAVKADGKFKGASFMQPVRKGDAAKSHLLVGSEAFAVLERDQVAAEDAFFYKFYTAKAAKKPARKRGKGADSSDEDSEGEPSSRKKAKKEKKKKAAGGESDEDIEDVDSDDDALERILRRGMGREEGGSEEEAGGDEAEEGEWDYDSLGKVLEKDDEADARSDDEESLEGGPSDEDDEGGLFEGFAEAGSDDDADVSEDGAEVSGDGEEDSDEEGFDFGEDASDSEGEDESLEGGPERSGKGQAKDDGGGSERKEKRKRGSVSKGMLDGQEEGEDEEEEPRQVGEGGESQKGSKKRRKKGGLGASPFAAMEDYAHMLV